MAGYCIKGGGGWYLKREKKKKNVVSQYPAGCVLIRYISIEEQYNISDIYF